MDSFYFTFKDGAIYEGHYFEVLAQTPEEAKAGADAAHPGQWDSGPISAEDFSIRLAEGGIKKLAVLHKIDGQWKVKKAG